MRKSFFVKCLILGALLTLTACQGQVQFVVVVSATPEPGVIMITVTPTTGGQVSGAATNTAALPTLTPIAPTSVPASPVAALTTATPLPQPTISAFPTETRAQIYIAQQDFENGYMFWISTTSPQQIWVLIKSASNPNQGEWRIYQDTYADGEPEIDATLKPPKDTLYQPRRGFGKLWRNTPGMREALGWGTTPEFNLNTTYVYQAGGSIDGTGKYTPGPGKHFLTNLSRQTFAFYEAVQGFGRWERVG